MGRKNAYVFGAPRNLLSRAPLPHKSPVRWISLISRQDYSNPTTAETFSHDR